MFSRCLLLYGPFGSKDKRKRGGRQAEERRNRDGRQDKLFEIMLASETIILIYNEGTTMDRHL
jgi:hypothetical protein